METTGIQFYCTLFSLGICTIELNQMLHNELVINVDYSVVISNHGTLNNTIMKNVCVLPADCKSCLDRNWSRCKSNNNYIVIYDDKFQENSFLHRTLTH